MIVVTPTRDTLVVERVYKGGQVVIEGGSLPISLILLDIHDFDVILGMDWLATHYATVDCFRKEVKFSTLGESDVVFRGERRMLPSCMISAMTAMKMLRK